MPIPDIKHMEGLLPVKYGDDADEIPGARAILDELTKAEAPWAIVTSGTSPLGTSSTNRDLEMWVLFDWTDRIGSDWLAEGS